jgi:hypothetical protein
MIMGVERVFVRYGCESFSIARMEIQCGVKNDGASAYPLES